MPAWIWFVVAALAAAGGALLLLSERSRSSAPARDRRRWAEQKSWEFVEVDPVLPSRWRYGAVHQGGHGRALDLATGAVPGQGGRRLAHVFDHEQAGQVTGIVAAVRGVAAVPVALELRLPSAPLPDDAGLDSLGQVGDRYAFVTDVVDGRPLITAELTRAADGVGDDVPLVWAEDTWVLASIDEAADTQRVQELLQSLVDVSVALEEAVAGPSDAGHDEEWFERFADGDDIRDDDVRDDAVEDDDVHDDDGRGGRGRGRGRGRGPRDDVGRGARDDDGPDDAVEDDDVHDDDGRGGRGRGPRDDVGRGARDDDGPDDAVEDDDVHDAVVEDDVDREHEVDAREERDGADRGRGAAAGDGATPTHRDRPGDIPYDVENDESGSGGRPRGPSSLFRGAPWGASRGR